MENETFEKIYESCRLEERIEDGVKYFGNTNIVNNTNLDFGDDEEDDEDDMDFMGDPSENQIRINKKIEDIMTAMGIRIPRQVIEKLIQNTYLYDGFSPSLEDIEKIARQYNLNKNEVRTLYTTSIDKFRRDYYEEPG